MTPTDIPTALALAISSVVLVLLLPGAIRSWQTYAGTRDRRQEDATGRAPAPGADVVERIGALEALGYRRIGVTFTSMPSGSGYTWVLGQAIEEVYALLAPPGWRQPGLTGFYSAWPDGEWLGTLGPFGVPYATEGLRIRIDKGGVVEAEASHRAAVQAMRTLHGAPKRVTSITDVLALDADYRSRFGGRELRPLLIRALLPVAATALVVVLLAVGLFVLP